MTKSALTLIALAFVLAACASADGRSSRYAADLARLEETCTARGGILTPARIGPEVGRPETEYACRINDGGSRLRD